MTTPDMFCQQVFELRFEPMGAFLDIRGKLADHVRKEMFKHWAIGENRLDFWDSDKREEDKNTAFVSYRNCGFVSIQPPTENFFEDKASKFLRVLSTSSVFAFPRATRLGVRSSFFAYSHLPFSELCQKFYHHFYQEQITRLFGGTVEDVGIIVNLRKDKSFFNITTGPMKKEQAVQYFKAKLGDLKDVGVYFDIDYFQTDLGKADLKDISVLIKTFSQESFSQLNDVLKLSTVRV